MSSLDLLVDLLISTEMHFSDQIFRGNCRSEAQLASDSQPSSSNGDSEEPVPVSIKFEEAKPEAKKLPRNSSGQSSGPEADVARPSKRVKAETEGRTG